MANSIPMLKECLKTKFDNNKVQGNGDFDHVGGRVTSFYNQKARLKKFLKAYRIEGENMMASLI